MWGVLMGRRGRKRQLDVEARYWQLLLAGIGTVQACRLVWITRKTDYRWRAENGGIPPARIAERPGRIATCPCSDGSGSRRCAVRVWAWEIARRIDRSAATVSRELRATCVPTTRPTTVTWHMPGVGSAPPPATRQAEPRRRTAEPGAGQAGVGLEPGTDRPPFATYLPGTAAVAYLPRDHLPGGPPITGPVSRRLPSRRRAVERRRYRSGRNPLRTSVVKRSGSCQAAKWLPASTSLK